MRGSGGATGAPPGSRKAAAFIAGGGLLAGLWAAGLATAAPGSRGTGLSLGLAPAGNSYAAGGARHGPATRPIRQAPVHNFGVVAPGCVYRSGQPTEAGFQWLKEQGFRSIVCLRKEHDDGAERMAAFGFHYLYLSIPDNHAPTKEQAEQFLSFARNPQNWPLLLHCGAGMGRAGCMAALVRHSFDGWDMGLALQEARHYRPASFPLVGSQRSFLKRWATTHPRGSLRPTTAAVPGGEETGE
jgi:protein tyrosine phosphatase (PTP) superfamily phosphohydrolase (DUF442 family)